MFAQSFTWQGLFPPNHPPLYKQRSCYIEQLTNSTITIFLFSLFLFSFFFLFKDCPLSDHGSEQLTENVCNLASKPSLFGSGTNCFPKPKPAPPICRQVHFSCETPECYPTARPLLCPDADGTYIEQKEASTAWGVIGKIILTALLPTAFLIYSAIAERQSIEKELEKLANKEFQDNRARTSETRVNGSTPQWAQPYYLSLFFLGLIEIGLWNLDKDFFFFSFIKRFKKKKVYQTSYHRI